MADRIVPESTFSGLGIDTTALFADLAGNGYIVIGPGGQAIVQDKFFELTDYSQMVLDPAYENLRTRIYSALNELGNVLHKDGYGATFYFDPENEVLSQKLREHGRLVTVQLYGHDTYVRPDHNNHTRRRSRRRDLRRPLFTDLRHDYNKFHSLALRPYPARTHPTAIHPLCRSPRPFLRLPPHRLRCIAAAVHLLRTYGNGHSVHCPGPLRIHEKINPHLGT